MPTINADSCPIHVEVEGPERAPVLMLSNSLGTTLAMWNGQIEPFTRHFRLVRYDRRGHGKSSVPKGPYSMERLGSDVLAVLDGLGIEKINWCGLSMDGMVGQWLGAIAPDRVDKLILSNTARSGLLGFAKTLASECARDNVLVNTVLPGHFDTDRAIELARMRAAREGRPVDDILSDRSRSIPLGRSGAPEEMAAVVAHEVKNPIAGIRGALQVIESRMPPEQRDRAVDAIESGRRFRIPRHFGLLRHWRVKLSEHGVLDLGADRACHHRRPGVHPHRLKVTNGGCFSLSDSLSSC